MIYIRLFETYISVFVSDVKMSMTDCKVDENFCSCNLTCRKVHYPRKSEAPSHNVARENVKPTDPSNEITGAFKE